MGPPAHARFGVAPEGTCAGRPTGITAGSGGRAIRPRRSRWRRLHRPIQAAGSGRVALRGGAVGDARGAARNAHAGAVAQAADLPRGAAPSASAGGTAGAAVGHLDAAGDAVEVDGARGVARAAPADAREPCGADVSAPAAAAVLDLRIDAARVAEREPRGAAAARVDTVRARRATEGASAAVVVVARRVDAAESAGREPHGAHEGGVVPRSGASVAVVASGCARRRCERAPPRLSRRALLAAAARALFHHVALTRPSPPQPARFSTTPLSAASRSAATRALFQRAALDVPVGRVPCAASPRCSTRRGRPGVWRLIVRHLACDGTARDPWKRAARVATAWDA
jgi:hypothetical protein